MEYSEEIFNFLSIVIPSGKGLDIINRGDLRLTLTKLTPNVDNLLLKHQIIREPTRFCPRINHWMVYLFQFLGWLLS
ncbi:unnamed protein product [Acanthoscelides obtectus]|uniref:Uncharacterized protein n=1 Tax=Acanthoscelides obtectus TaxID=200917 RepID=A0A9P0KZM2_ACAOB|nr:unnamed protein product [Acanthoscelides obtectus]CAK1639212.1 hypothetical protein AOBTE_LOCUS11049 [Acanthoscelides obtectus]